MFIQNLTSTLHQMFSDVANSRFIDSTGASGMDDRDAPDSTLDFGFNPLGGPDEADLAQRVREAGEW